MAEASSSQSDKEHVDRVLQNANSFCNGQLQQVSLLYRNQTAEYFEEVKRNGNVMKPRLKDTMGSPKSPINGRLEGVFFCVTLVSGKLPTISPYGDIRICIPIEAVFNESSYLYFADFYTLGGPRYIILVLTKPGTDADQFCKENLPELDPEDNLFLYRSRDDGQFYTAAQRGLMVEIFYTENVDIDCLKSLYGEDKVYKKSGFGPGVRG